MIWKYNARVNIGFIAPFGSDLEGKYHVLFYESNQSSSPRNSKNEVKWEQQVAILKVRREKIHPQKYKVMFETLLQFKESASADMNNKFLYFAYGSNLLARRIHINNPTAVRRGIAKLENYQLNFKHWSNRWKGCAATIVPACGKHVWGAVWEVDLSNKADLDKQEGVPMGVYFPLEVTVQTPNGKQLNCRSYQLCDNPPPLKDGEILPVDRHPSHLYLNVIIKGAEESGLPETYIADLKNIPHNEFNGEIDINGDINIPLTLETR